MHQVPLRSAKVRIWWSASPVFETVRKENVIITSELYRSLIRKFSYSWTTPSRHSESMVRAQQSHIPCNEDLYGEGPPRSPDFFIWRRAHPAAI